MPAVFQPAVSLTTAPDERHGHIEIRRIAVSYARGLMGAMLIGVHVMMTMEVWWEGFFVPAWHLILLYAVNYGVLFILQHYSGLTHRKTLSAQASAALVAYGIGVFGATITLLALGVLRSGITVRDVVGKLVLESVPLSIGASVAMSEFGEEHRVAKARREQAGYWGSLGMAIAGAALLGFGFAATEEPLMVAEQLDWVRALLLVGLSLLLVYAIVYAVDFKKQADAGSASHLAMVLRDTISTYAVAILMAAYFLWTFGAINASTGLVATTYMVVTVGLVTSLGAAAAELLI
jgi:putative integral membrane protein (TIGR02587 family)